MKAHLNKKTLWRSLLSVTALSIFILLAVGSADLLNLPVFTVDKGNGVKEESFYNLVKDTKRITTGKQDDQGRWMGKVTIVYVARIGSYTEEAHMAYGVRQGISTRTYADGHKEDAYYVNGEKVDPFKKAAHSLLTDVSAFQILYNKYPWFLFALNACDFGDEYVEAFTDTVETVLNTYEFDISEFDSYYEDVLSVLEETPYDSIIILNSKFFLAQGIQELKNAELRLAVLDHCRSEGSSTYDIVNTTYPGYLLSLNDSGVVNQDFEKFCQDLDDSLTSYGPLDLEDPFFVDSVDSRLYRALFSIISAEESSFSLAKLSMKNRALANGNFDVGDIYNKVNTFLKPQFIKSGTPEVAAIVVSGMLIHFIRGDILRRIVREAYSIQKGIIGVPNVATIFSGNNSSTSVTVQGFIIEDGGAAVTSRGIAWDAFYNPTTDDNTVTSGTGTGNFTVTLDGLTEGTTYYARTYASNTAGTAYGNCISFVAASPTDIADNKVFTQVFTIYPNPASAITTISFLLESSEGLVLNVLDMKGQRVFYHDLGRLPQGINQIDLNLSGLRDGVYNCQLTNGAAKVTRKLVIAHQGK
jgi:hypothetical protein